MQHKEFQRAGNKTDLDNREAAGFWKAIALANDIGRTHREIDLSAILELNKCILEQANPEAAGRFRIAGEDIKKLTCIVPPPGSVIQEEMHEFEGNMKYKIKTIPTHSPKPNNKNAHKEWIDSVFDLAAWVQHSLVAIHPFCEANGRTSRLMTNVILRRFNLPSSDVKIEADDKEKYVGALCQIDEHNDYKPLKDMILKGSLSTLKKERDIRIRKQS